MKWDIKEMKWDVSKKTMRWRESVYAGAIGKEPWSNLEPILHGTRPRACVSKERG